VAWSNLFEKVGVVTLTNGQENIIHAFFICIKLSLKIFIMKNLSFFYRIKRNDAIRRVFTLHSFLVIFMCAAISQTHIFAQNSGRGFNYQAVVRGADGFVMPSKPVELRFSLMTGQQATQASWVETHSVTTDALGTIGVTVGNH